MTKLLQLLHQQPNRKALALVGAAIVTIVSGAWAVIAHFFPAGAPFPANSQAAVYGPSLIAGGNMFDNKITIYSNINTVPSAPAAQPRP